MPNERQVHKVKEEFYAVAGFPNVIGCIDGTHIPMQAPSVDENDYVNRKGFHSINCQMVCDPWNRFTNVVTKWPGSAHDSWTLRGCGLGQQLVEGKHNGTLLGDSGYPCREYLLVPYPKPQGRAQEKFNRSLCTTRVKIEQSFGILKRKFACLKCYEFYQRELATLSVPQLYYITLLWTSVTLMMMVTFLWICPTLFPHQYHLEITETEVKTSEI